MRNNNGVRINDGYILPVGILNNNKNTNKVNNIPNKNNNKQTFNKNNVKYNPPIIKEDKINRNVKPDTLKEPILNENKPDTMSIPVSECNQIEKEIRKLNREIIKHDVSDEVIEENIDEEEKDDIVIDEKINVDSRYVTRDMSWITFQKRLLSLANNPDIPLLERFNFLAITASNLDEFTTVRLSGLGRRNGVDINGLTYEKEASIIKKDIDDFLDKQEEILEILLNELEEKTGYVLVRKRSQLDDAEKEFIKDYFNTKVKSSLTPIVADNNRPFPMIMNNTINIGITLKDNLLSKLIFATVQLPDMERVIEIEGPNKKFILLEDLIKLCIGRLFIGKEIDNMCQYRLLRDLDYMVEDNNAFIVDTMKETLKRREMGKIMRLDISGQKKEIVKVLHRAFKLSKKEVNKSDTIIDLSFCRKISKLNIDPEIKKSLKFEEFYAPISDELIDETNIFDKIDEDDIILHHPYESYDSVVDFIKQASTDKHVVAIKQTLYRVSDNSPIMRALIEAAENGKQVTVILEVKARFDEANNLRWASELERAGGHVIYGINNFKIHSKMCLVVRRNKKGVLNRYVHIGTGNYNEENAKLYTDLSLFSSRNTLCNDVEKLFNALSGFSEPKFKKILASPYNLKEELIRMMDDEIKHGKDGKIFIKVNGLTDKDIVDKLYEAAEAGVQVDLIVRTACSIRPINGIRIKTIVGRFLEHSRVYYFEHADNKFYIGSSDLMERNLYNRVEVAVPVDNELYNYMYRFMDFYIKDISESCFTGNNIVSANVDIKSNCQRKFMELSMTENNIENINKMYVLKE